MGGKARARRGRMWWAPRVGDWCHVNVSADGRQWGYRPCPNGTSVYVVDHRHRSSQGGPNLFWPLVELPNGDRIEIWAGYLKKEDA